MLHRVSCLLGLMAATAWAQDAGVTPGGPDRAELPRAILTQGDRAGLRADIERQVVRIRRPNPRDSRVIVPGGVKPIEARGWRAGRGRVVTASAVAQGWPRSSDDKIEVEVDGEWRSAAVGLTEPLLGLAVLDAPGVGAPKTPARAPPVGAVFTGRPVYFVADGRLGSARVGVAAGGQRAYYVWLEGAKLPLGTPLFDDRARAITLVGLDALEAPGRSLILPEKALRALFERKSDWLQ